MFPVSVIKRPPRCFSIWQPGGIYANLDKFKGKQLENLTNYKDDAFLSRQVATIVRDADFELDLESISFPNFNAEQVTEAFTDVRMMAHLAKMLETPGGEAAPLIWALGIISLKAMKRRRPSSCLQRATFRLRGRLILRHRFLATG